MKKSLLCLAICLLSGVLFAQDAVNAPVQEPSFKVALQGEQSIFAPGTVIPFTFTYTFPETLCCGAWRAFAYETMVPKNFAEAVNVKAAGSDPRWRMICFMGWNWTSNPAEGSVNTAGWPAGDYRITINILVRNKENPEDKSDKYLEAYLDFTLE